MTQTIVMLTISSGMAAMFNHLLKETISTKLLCTHLIYCTPYTGHFQSEQKFLQEIIIYPIPSVSLTLSLSHWSGPILFHFRTFDISDRSMLSYKDFLYGVAAMEPSTPHGSLTGEIRCRYIFRFYNKSNTGQLEPNEFRWENVVRPRFLFSGHLSPSQVRVRVKCPSQYSQVYVADNYMHLKQVNSIGKKEIHWHDFVFSFIFLFFFIFFPSFRVTSIGLPVVTAELIIQFTVSLETPSEHSPT